jgi:Tol biopolymer transport system component
MIPAVVSTPAFASAGTASFQDEGAHRTLVSANSSGPGTVLKITRVLDDEGRNYHARPSPDGALVAFDSDRDGMRGVYVATADGTGVRRISGDGFAALPSWSPDGQRLAFVKAEPGHPAVWNLWIADLGSGEARQVTFYRTGQRWGGSWFPDGHRLAYTHQDGLVVQDLNTGAKKTYRSPLPGRLLRTPAVSPDGRRIIFHVDRDGTWLLDLTSGGIRRVLDDPTADGYTWSADGRRVAFHSERAGGWGVWVMGE